jgi:hypothetical protein
MWTVPPAPATQSGQTIYLFNGMQDSVPMILQPVLQWGALQVGGGNSWTVASWYGADIAGSAFYTPSFPSMWETNSSGS